MEGNFEDILKKEYDMEAEEIRRSIAKREDADAEFAALEADDSMKQEFVQMLRAENAAAQALHAEDAASQALHSEDSAAQVLHEAAVVLEGDIAPEDARLLAQMSEEAREAYRLGRKLLEKRARGDYDCEMAEESCIISLERDSVSASANKNVATSEDDSAVSTGDYYTAVPDDEYVGAKESDHASAGGAENAEPSAADGDTTKKVVRFRRKRVYLIIALVAVLVMGFGMTSFGGKNYVMEMIDKIMPGKDQTMMNSKEEERKYSDRKDNEAYAQINEELGTDVVELLYLPKGYYLEEIDIDSDADRSCMSYTDGRNIWLQYYMYVNQSDQSIAVYHDDKVLNEEQIAISETLIDITEYQDTDSNVYYEAVFTYDDVNYRLIGNIGQVEFKKIVKNLFFY